MDIKHFYLFLTVSLHIIIILSCIFFILSYSLFNYDNTYLNIIVILTVLSFLCYRKCILIDVYDYIKDCGYKDQNVPHWAKDNFLRNYVKNLFGIKIDDVDYTQYRLDKIDNIEPIKDSNSSIQKDIMFNHKMHYILGNFVLMSAITSKYNLNHSLPLLFGWVFYVFKL